jgi:hypothetical protein
MSLLVSVLSFLAGCDGNTVGCGAPCEDFEGDDPDTGVPLYVREEPEAELTAEEVGQRLFEVFGQGFPNGELVKDTYLAMMAMGDPTCPASETILTEAYILGCTAESGYYFSGVCVYDEQLQSDELGSTLTWGLGGDFSLNYPDGAEFAAGGGATYTGHRAPDGTERFQATLRGTWYDESQANWLGQGFSGLFSVEGGLTAGKPALEVHGGVAVGEADLFFDHVSWDWAGSCEGAPSGGVRLRDTRGYWYVWTLDDDCDPCGNVLFHGEIDLGELCLDLKPVGEDIYHSLAVP